MKQLLLMTVLCGLTMPAAAADPGDDAYMIRIMKCVGADANMELYLPQSVVFKRDTPLSRTFSRCRRRSAGTRSI